MINLALCRVGFAAPIQQATGSISTGGTINFAGNATPGNLVIVLIDSVGTGATVSSVTGLGATWTHILAETSGNNNLDCWSAIVVTLGTGVTITTADAPAITVNISEWSGYQNVQDSGSPVGSAVSIVPGNITTTNANDLLIALAGSLASTPTGPGAPWTALSTANAFALGVYQVVSSTGTYGAPYTGGSGHPAAIMAAFQATTSPPPTSGGGVILAMGYGNFVPTPSPTPTPTPTPTPSPTPSPTPTPGGLPTPPVLVSPVSPTTFGADSTGTNDSSAAFENAMAANHDLDVTAGTYVLGSPGQGSYYGVNMGNGRVIKCEPGVTFIYKGTNLHPMFAFNSGSGGGIYNCTFHGPYFGQDNQQPQPGYGGDCGTHSCTGPCSTSPPYTISAFVDLYHWSGAIFAGNTMDGIAGFNGAIEMATIPSGSGNASNGNRVSNNTFKNCGLAGVEISTGYNNRVDHNTFMDCSADEEGWAADSNQLNNMLGGNTWDNNTITMPHGVGQGLCGYPGGQSARLSGGLACHTSPCPNYCSNTVQSNNIQGPAAVWVYEAKTGGGSSPAKYIGNSCTNGCSFNNGPGCAGSTDP